MLKRIYRRLFKKNKEDDFGVNILHDVNQYRGVLWEKIEKFNELLKLQQGVVLHHTKEMEDMFPLKHNIENGMYTREIFMPKGSLVSSFIHKQNHPSFFMSGDMSLLMDTGEVKRVKAPEVIMTETGTQRIAYMHEDCTWVCVYRTNAKTIEEAEKEVYTEDYRDLPRFIITKRKELCQD
jgi:hypothetical protein